MVDVIVRQCLDLKWVEATVVLAGDRWWLRLRLN